MGSTLKKKRLPKKQVEVKINDEQAHSITTTITTIHDYFRKQIKEDRVEVLLDFIINTLKEESANNRDLYSHCGPIRWARNKISENKLALRLLRAYKKNPRGLTLAVREADDINEDFDFGGDLN